MQSQNAELAALNRGLEQLVEAIHAEAATGDVRLCAVVIDCDESTGHARSIQRIMVG